MPVSNALAAAPVQAIGICAFFAGSTRARLIVDARPPSITSTLSLLTSFSHEATAVAGILPAETAHLPPPRFTKEDQVRFQRFLDIAAPVGPKFFNIHLMPAKAAAGVPLDVRTAWLAELVDAAHSRGLTITLENVEEPLSILAEVFTRIPRMKACLDIGHASLDGDNERPYQLLSLIRDRLALVHAHDNRQGHGEAGDLHLPFGRGTIRIESILQAVRGTGFDGHVTLELFSGTREDKADCAARARAWLAGSFGHPSPI